MDMVSRMGTIAVHLPLGAHGLLDVVRLITSVGAFVAVMIYARAAVQYRDHTKGGLPAAYMPSNLALALALIIGLVDQVLRIGEPATWRLVAYFALVALTHWSFHRMGMAPWAQRTAWDELSPATLRLLRRFEVLGEAVFTLAPDGTCTTVNNMGINLLGYRREEMVGTNMHRLVHYKHPDGTPMPVEECPLHRAVLSGQRIKDEQTVLWDRWGEPIRCTFAATPVVEDGKVTGAVVVFSERVD